jgi:lipoprotein-releasing system permease protein
MLAANTTIKQHNFLIWPSQKLGVKVRFSTFIATRLLRVKTEASGFSAPVVRIATAGIALGIGVMIIAVAIVKGFQNEIRGKVIGFGSHIQITQYDSNKSLEDTPFQVNPELESRLKQIPSLKALHRVARKPGIVKSGDIIEGVVFKGFGYEDSLSFFKKHLVSGRLPKMTDSSASKEVLISSSLARKLNRSTDSSLVVYFIQDPPKTRKFKISGMYETGLGDQDFDKIYIVGDIRVIQRVNNWGADTASAIEIDIKDYGVLNSATNQVYDVIPPDLTCRNIEEQYPQIFAWLEVIDTNVVVVIGLMLVVSLINMITSLLILILEKVRMIGILKALGSDNFQIAKIFLIQSAWMNLKGLFIGNLLAISFCILQSKFKFITLDQDSYYLSSVPIDLSWSNIALLNIGFFCVCMITLILPAMIVARFKPSQTIRFA